MSGIFASQRIDLRFGDFKATDNAVNYKKIPDVASFDITGTVKFIGEVKPPWIEDHKS